MAVKKITRKQLLEYVYEILEEELNKQLFTTDTIDNIVTVIDSEGGRWIPSKEAQAEIKASPNPEAAAIRICAEEPMRGVWKQ